MASAVKRLIIEMERWKEEAAEEPGIERLGPADDEDLMQWEAVINGKGIPGGYEDGRWLLAIQLPSDYPHKPPRIHFATPILHANVAPDTGEICLDLLTSAWRPTYTVMQCVKAVRMLMAEPATDSPLNVDIAKVLSLGDSVGAKALVECFIRVEGARYEGS